MLDELRRGKRDERYLAEVQTEYAQQEVEDDVLRLLFVCADPVIPPESQLVLALKTLCGFSTGEIALRLFQSEEAIHKRLQRARDRLREQAELAAVDPQRVPSVLHMLYLLFNEGYSSAQPDRMIRRELCDEALRLALMLREEPAGAVPERTRWRRSCAFTRPGSTRAWMGWAVSCSSRSRIPRSGIAS